MTTDNWLDDNANWDTPSDWSLGLPGPMSDVVINSANEGPEVTASIGAVNSISIAIRRASSSSMQAQARSPSASPIPGTSTLIRTVETEGLR
jgi:hypothetical protein